MTDSEKSPTETRPETTPDIKTDIETGTAAAAAEQPAENAPAPGLKGPEQMPGEIGGPAGPEPTRYGDWAFKGRCSDF